MTEEDSHNHLATDDGHDVILILFGATGDLAKRKLLPGLFHLFVAGLMPKRFRIIGTSPPGPDMDSSRFPDYVRTSLESFGRMQVTDATFNAFSDALSYAGSNPANMDDLKSAIADAKAALGTNPKVIIYLAVPPSAFIPVVEALGDSGIAHQASLIIEKPFGSDLASAKALNAATQRVFAEERIYRIDHFLGKEAVQNVLALRFANTMFEPAWHRDYLAYVQIDVPETLTIEGRGSFYEANGAFRDMVVTHLFQVMGFLAMERPSAFEAEVLHEKKKQLFAAIRPLSVSDVVFGQYDGYLKEPGVAPDSKIETFVAARVFIDNDRWRGVPFFLRTGKAMAVTNSCVTLGFKTSDFTCFGDRSDTAVVQTPNELVLELSDPGSVKIKFLAKRPGAEMVLAPTSMKFAYSDSFNEKNELEAYERLLHDVLIGDRTLFNAAGGIERLWEVSEPILTDPPIPESYQVGSFGPQQAIDLVAPHKWHLRSDNADSTEDEKR